MTPLTRVDEFLTSPKARPFSISLAEGARLAILGPSPCGKTRLLQALRDGTRESPILPIERLSARVFPERALKGFSPTAKAEALTAAGLWEHRRTPVEALSPGQRLACRLLPCLAAREGLVLLDGELDHLDLWTLESVLQTMVAPSRTALAVVTSRPDVAEQMSRILLLTPRGLRLEGTPDELRSSAEPFSALIQTETTALARQACAALQLQVMEDGENLRIALDGGLEDAARLALHGYAALDAITIRRPTLGQVLRERGPS